MDYDCLEADRVTFPESKLASITIGIPQVMSHNSEVTGLTPLSPEEKIDASLTTSQVERKLIEAYITRPPFLQEPR